MTPSGRRRPAGPSNPDPARAGSTPSIVVVGSINMDQVVRISRRPGRGETVGDGTIEFLSGGKGANQAVAAARCGASVALVGRVGNDPYGETQRAALSAEGVDIDRVLVTDDIPTGLAIVTVTPDGENSIIVVPGANRYLTPADVDAASALIAGAKVLVIQLEVPIPAVERAVELAANKGIVVLNCAPFRELPASVLSASTVLVANELEAAALASLPAGTPGAALDAAARIVNMGPRCAVVTLGPLGAVVVGPREHAHVLAKRVQVVDTTGAGDAFVGAMAAALAMGRHIVDAVRCGVDVGSATTTQHGARAVVPCRGQR